MAELIIAPPFRLRLLGAAGGVRSTKNNALLEVVPVLPNASYPTTHRFHVPSVSQLTVVPVKGAFTVPVTVAAPMVIPVPI